MKLAPPPFEGAAVAPVWLVLLLTTSLLLATTAFAQSPESSDVVVVTFGYKSGEAHFEPKGLHVAPGTTIRFLLEGRIEAHDVVAYHPDNGGPLRIPEGAEAFRSPMLREIGEYFDLTLTIPGVYDYYCGPHESMKMVGRIIVGDPAVVLAQRLEPFDGLKHKVLARAFPSVENILEQGVVTFDSYLQAKRNAR